MSGFELELFSAHEYPYLYWYLYELLFPWLTTCLHKADSHLIEYEHYAENQTKSQGKIIFNNKNLLKALLEYFILFFKGKSKKKPKNSNKNKKPRPYAKEITHCQAFSTLCSGYFKVYFYTFFFKIHQTLITKITLFFYPLIVNGCPQKTKQNYCTRFMLR